MFSDFIGFSEHLEEDDKNAFNQQRKNRRLHKRLIKKFNGRWLKEMGGGILASFHSNIDAVICAVAIRKATEELNIPIRIGIHLGDVLFEKKDILGDGVNIASRIQNALSSSGIVISEKVYSDIKNKKGLNIELLGAPSLKGVSTPLDIYRITCEDESQLDFSIDTGELVRPFRISRTKIAIGVIIISLLAYAAYYFLSDKSIPDSDTKKSVLVMPFDNYLGSDTLEYFVAGMHDALIGDIGKISALQVKSKTTANAYKNTEKSIPEIAEELGVNTLLKAR